jgi:colicin import membrane protein
MIVQAIPRMFVEGALSAVRLPIDGALRVAGLMGAGESAELAVDRADAAVRAAAGATLRDEALATDARRRRAAADARREALELHAEAELRSERAERRAREREQEAETRRKEAAEEAERKREQAKKQREATKAKASRTAGKRKEQAEESAVRSKHATKEREKRETLDQLDTKSEALSLKEAALTAADEARRLGEEATNAKSSRKNGS